MFSRGRIIAAIISNVVIVLVISKLATGSLNPLEVFREEDLLVKIIVGFFLFAIVMGLLYLPFLGAISEKSCACVEPTPCGKPLVAFAGALGNPVRCAMCGRWYHQKCFRANGGSLREGCKQPHCPSGASQLLFR